MAIVVWALEGARPCELLMSPSSSYPLNSKSHYPWLVVGIFSTILDREQPARTVYEGSVWMGKGSGG